MPNHVQHVIRMYIFGKGERENLAQGSEPFLHRMPQSFHFQFSHLWPNMHTKFMKLGKKCQQVNDFHYTGRVLLLKVVCCLRATSFPCPAGEYINLFG